MLRLSYEDLFQKILPKYFHVIHVKLKPNMPVFILKSFVIFPSKTFMYINGKYGEVFSNITGKPVYSASKCKSHDTNLFSLALTEKEENHYILLSSLIPSHV